MEEVWGRLPVEGRRGRKKGVWWKTARGRSTFCEGEWVCSILVLSPIWAYREEMFHVKQLLFRLLPLVLGSGMFHVEHTGEGETKGTALWACPSRDHFKNREDRTQRVPRRTCDFDCID